MYCLRSVGRDPGRLASSIVSAVSVSSGSFEGVEGRCVSGMFSGCGSSRITGRVGVSHCDRGSIEGEGIAEVVAVGAGSTLGCDIEFWPGSVSPLARPAQIWCVKFVLIDGRTEMLDGIQHMLLSKYIELSNEPQNSRALCSISHCHAGSHVKCSRRSSPSQKEVTNTGILETKHTIWSCSFHQLQIEQVQETSNEFSFR